jgi:4'-phosphopantetheinyl transferase EntD
MMMMTEPEASLPASISSDLKLLEDQARRFLAEEAAPGARFELLAKKVTNADWARDFASWLPSERLTELSKFEREARRLEWLHSRRIEVELAERLGKAKPSLSITHTEIGGEPWVLGAGLTTVNSRAFIGIDWEDRDREIDDGVQAKITAETEKNLPLAPLELWVAKEAAFKASPYNHEQVIWTYLVSEYDSLSKRGSFTGPDSAKENGRFLIFTGASFRAAIAFLSVS